MPAQDGPRRPSIDRRRFLALCGAAALAGCSAADDGTPSTTTTSTTTTTTETTRTERTTTARPSFSGTWPGYGYDLANTGYNTESPALSGDAGRWSTFVEGYRTLPAPAVSESGVYIGSAHKLFGFVRANGDTAWDVDMGRTADRFTHKFTPTVRDGVVYGVARDLAGADSGSDRPGTLVAVDEMSGAIRWRKEPYVSGSPTVVDDLVVYPTSTVTSGAIEARHTTDGSLAWRDPFGDPSGSFGAPAYADGVLYATATIGDRDPRTGRVVALDPATGDRRWTRDVDGGANSAPVVAGDAVIFADDRGTVHSIDRSDRTERWRVSVGDSVYATPAVTPDRVFAISGGTLSAIDRGAGAVTWTAPIGASHFSSVSVVADTVIVGGPTLYAYDRATGDPQLTRAIPGYAGAYGGPVVVDGAMFIGACVKQEAGDLYDNFVYKLS